MYFKYVFMRINAQYWDWLRFSLSYVHAGSNPKFFQNINLPIGDTKVIPTVIQTDARSSFAHHKRHEFRIRKSSILPPEKLF